MVFSTEASVRKQQVDGSSAASAPCTVLLTHGVMLYRIDPARIWEKMCTHEIFRMHEVFAEYPVEQLAMIGTAAAAASKEPSPVDVPTELGLRSTRALTRALARRRYL